MSVRIICESAELAVECLQAAQSVGLAVEPEVEADWLSAVSRAPTSGAKLAIACATAPRLEDLVELGHLARARRLRALFAILAPGSDADCLRQAALDLGLTAVTEVEALISALCLLEADAKEPWFASVRNLGRPDRVRLSAALAPGARDGGQFTRAEAGLLAFSTSADQPGRVVGRARDLALAVASLRDTDREPEQVESSVDAGDARAVTDVLFGPKRALSDHASKIALAPYGIPFPSEELCASASRAAVEANRLTYPVRISLTSPDLRIWDHPDLAVDMVDNAARVRDTFRQLMELAKLRLATIGADPRANERLLGVMVTATSEAAALLGVRAWPQPRGRVGMEIGFADPHGSASDDRTLTVLPAPLSAIERVLQRLRGSALLFAGSVTRRKANLDAIGDVLLRVSAFVHDRREEVEGVELRPLALLLDGSVEVRETCVKVSDAFERSLARTAERAAGS